MCFLPFRYQCVPLYQVSVQLGEDTDYTPEIYSTAREKIPPIAWTTKDSTQKITTALPIQDRDATLNWPFSARTIFYRMGVDDEKAHAQSAAAGGAGDFEYFMSESEESLAKKLEMLIALGFDDEFENRSALFKFDYNLDNTVNFLFDEQIQRQNQEDSKAGLTNVHDKCN